MYRDRIDFIKHLVLEAGQLTREGFGKCDQLPKDIPEGYYDIATEYDLRAEELVKRRILDEFGEPILGEEDGLVGDRETAKRRLWIVDPIDGTFNYQRGLPLYAVSIAFCENGIPVCGGIYLPALNELFSAAKGCGAFLSTGDSASPVPIRVSQERELASLVISIAGSQTYGLVAACASVGVPWRSLRLLVGAVASMAYIAVGRMEIFTDTSLHLWDCAAGDVILQEAGGPATVDYVGTPIFPEYVNRRLDLGDTGGISLKAASSPELLEDPLHRLISAAGL